MKHANHSTNPGSDRRTPFVGGSHEYSTDGVLDPESRSMFFFAATVITPSMSMNMVGVGSQYALASHDAGKAQLDGGQSYKLHLPAGIPAKNFWSPLVYDTQTRSYLQTD